jgi:hypothetical protein
MITDKNIKEFIFKSSIDLMIEGLIREGVDLEDSLYWLKNMVGDYEERIKKEI